MATLAELRTAVARDLRDSDLVTFKAPGLNDLINAGIEEIDRVYPVEKVVTIDPLANTFDYSLASERMVEVFRVEHVRNDLLYQVVNRSDHDEVQNGWEFFAGSLRFGLPGVATAWFDPDTDEFRVWGYASRAQLTADAQVAELDTTAEWGVRAYAKAMGLQMLQHDRALYSQWQAMSQNSDLSPNQINQMVALASSEWDHLQKRLRRLRRV